MRPAVGETGRWRSERLAQKSNASGSGALYFLRDAF
jgi:hypothetical protein